LPAQNAFMRWTWLSVREVLLLMQ